MTTEHLEPRAAASAPMSCAQLAIVLAAAGRVEDPVSRMTELAILSPGVAPWLPACRVERIDAEDGVVEVPTASGGWANVGLGRRASAVVAELVAGRTDGYLVEDGHDEPVPFDDCASDYAVELLGRADGRTAAFRWSLGTLRASALHQLCAAGVSEGLLLVSAGVTPPGTCPRAARHLQLFVAEYWSRSLALHRAAVVALGFEARLLGRGTDPSFSTYALTAGRP